MMYARNGQNDSVKLGIQQKNRRFLALPLQVGTLVASGLILSALTLNTLSLSGCKTAEKHQWVGDDEPIVMPSRTPPAVDSQQYSTENNGNPMDGDSTASSSSQAEVETESKSAIRLDNPEFKSSIPVKPKVTPPMLPNTPPTGLLQNPAMRAPTVIAPPRANNLYGVMPTLPVKPKRVDSGVSPLRLQPILQPSKPQAAPQMAPVNVQQNSTFRTTPPNASGINYARERAANTPRPMTVQPGNTGSPQSQPLPQSQAVPASNSQQVQNASRPINLSPKTGPSNLDPPPRRPALSSPHPLPNAIPHSAMPRPIAPNGSAAAPVSQPVAEKAETTSGKPAKTSPFSALRSMTSKAVDKTKQLGQKFHKNGNAADPSANNTGRARIDLPEDSSR
ncbi:MAG: hypothetical protein K2X01_00635 [Cyanobacteria bacterium]|nr:hypothetical protein [Cyanobacteriota bacterium]